MMMMMMMMISWDAVGWLLAVGCWLLAVVVLDQGIDARMP
jgi:hypothetical protein